MSRALVVTALLIVPIAGAKKPKSAWECTLRAISDAELAKEPRIPSHEIRDDEEHAWGAAADKRPELLTKNDIKAAMAPVENRVACCHQAYRIRGLAPVLIAISPDGTVAWANVLVDLPREALGKCIHEAVMSARFPAFAGNENQIVQYPFLLGVRKISSASP